MPASVPDQLLHVDLSSAEISWESVPTRWTRRFLGGKGLGARYLYDAVGPETDPLAPENALLLLVGPLTGYLPDDGRFAAVTKSPLTGLFLDSYAGGSFGPALRATFPDAAGIVITGQSTDPQVLDLRDGIPTLVPGEELADAKTDEVDAAYPDAAVLCVGPAGEAGVSFATIASDGGAHHAGRGGAGAVMGTKGLKAVVLDRKSPEPPNADIERLREETREAFAESPYGRAYRTAGTLETVEFADELSMLPTRGWQDRTFDGAADLGLDAVEAVAEDREEADETFPGDFRVRIGDYETVIRGGTPIALGAGLGFDDFDAVSALGATCDRLGIDVISGGNVVALAILASRAGHLDRDLAFGDIESVRTLMEEIGYRETALGDTLADGVDVAASELDLPDAIPTVKAMAVPSFDPRGAPAMALAYATSDRGACHRRSVPATVEAFRGAWTSEDLARAIADEQDRRALHWSLIVDDVTDPMIGDLGRRWLDALGLSIDREALSLIGTRTWTMTRLFNVREGVDRDADALPELFRQGRDGLDPDTFRRTLERYYAVRGWDRSGRPTRPLLERLGLLEIVDDDQQVGESPRPTQTDGAE